MTEDNTSVGVSKENWKKLSQLKLDKDFKDLNAVITYLLENQKRTK